MPKAIIHQGFWFERLQVNAFKAIFHQWRQLEASGCIENFRIAAGLSDGLRQGWFFADSDAYKWLDAAARIWCAQPDPQLAVLMDDFITLLAQVQAPDGYLFTYNQIHFPTVRWQNLQIEHELYCHGHLIEAGVSHFQATGRSDLLEIARKAADRIVADFLGKGPDWTPGHEEIEIALLRLHEISPGDTVYLQLARQFIELRGRTPRFALSILRQSIQAGKRDRYVQMQKQEYLAAHPEYKPDQLPPGNQAKKPWNVMLRWYASALSGKYFQQHAPVRQQTIPVGHAVRFAYLETAMAMLARLEKECSLVETLERAWERMLARRMYVTGGIGSLPALEGFGRDDELDPECAYAETCAALGSLFWNWEMLQLTGEARYSDLFEWQLYNAAAVGLGLEGDTYFYNNPLACRNEVSRKAWYAVPCCPSNLSRTWADLGKYIYSIDANAVTIHQYISNRSTVFVDVDNSQKVEVRLEMQSSLPWEGEVMVRVVDVVSANSKPAGEFSLRFRQPSWADRMVVSINGSSALETVLKSQSGQNGTSAGLDPHRAEYRNLRRVWEREDEVAIHFEMPIQLRKAHPRVKGHADRVAVSCGPLVYCLECVDNPGVDIFSAQVDPKSLSKVYDPDRLGGILKIVGLSTNGEALTFIPYFLWGNRGPSKMTVWVNA